MIAVLEGANVKGNNLSFFEKTLFGGNAVHYFLVYGNAHGSGITVIAEKARFCSAFQNKFIRSLVKLGCGNARARLVFEQPERVAG